jgi:hypothetical protein
LGRYHGRQHDVFLFGTEESKEPYKRPCCAERQLNLLTHLGCSPAGAIFCWVYVECRIEWNSCASGVPDGIRTVYRVMPKMSVSEGVRLCQAHACLERQGSRRLRNPGCTASVACSQLVCGTGRCVGIDYNNIMGPSGHGYLRTGWIPRFPLFPSWSLPTNLPCQHSANS